MLNKIASSNFGLIFHKVIEISEVKDVGEGGKLLFSLININSVLEHFQSIPISKEEI